MQKRLRKKSTLFFCYLLLCLSFFLFSGCSSATGESFKILSASLAWIRKDWTRAASSFLEVTNSDSIRLKEYASYGLAATYLAQEEHEAALFRLSQISQTEDVKLSSGLWYQVGVIAWRKGALKDASEFFKKSLEYDSTALDAKINLELIHQQFAESVKTRSSSSTAISDVKSNKSDSLDALYTVVKKKEMDRWKNQKTEQSRSSVADY